LNKSETFAWTAAALLGMCGAASPAASQETGPAGQESAPAAEQENDGTDPTRPVKTLSVSYEHLDLRGDFTSDSLILAYTQPIGSGRNSLKAKLPLSSIDVLGNDRIDVGDISIKYTMIPKVTRSFGVVIGAEMTFDTASRAELGTGQNVFKGTLIYAKFLKNGGIFAPALVHSISVWGDGNRPAVNSTTVDLYYVPRLRNRSMYMTIDPAMTVDWENDREFPSLSVTLGYKLGRMMGGKGQMFVKPSASFAQERPVNWGVEVGFQLLSF
jgi:hypothetical protein